MIKRIFSILRELLHFQLAHRYALKRGAPGVEFVKFSRKIGLQLIIKRKCYSLGYITNPVSLTRFFEFPFSFSCLPETLGKCLDVSSPRLFSFYVATRNPATTIRMINPYWKDADHSAMIVSKLRMHNIKINCQGVNAILSHEDKYDCIWSISVIEHINCEYNDSHAIEIMYNSLTPGGRLILTVPVDRKFWIEYRHRNYYENQIAEENSEYFFQRIYDKDAIWKRLLGPIKKEPEILRWFGETRPGRFLEFERRSMAEGQKFAVVAHKEVADYFREFAKWEDMPGMGVCGLMVQKDG